MSIDYSKYIIKEYKFWSLQVNEDQSYLGRCVIWCKRENADDLAEITPGEQEELFKIIKNIKMVLHVAFEPDLINYTFLGNKTPHVHCHVIPRYKTPRELMGITFTDEKWGSNPYKGEYKSLIFSEVSEEVKQKLREIFQQIK